MKRILFAGAEVMPFSATGGLGDVLGSLPKAIKNEGDFDVRVVMPLYKSVKAEWRAEMKTEREIYIDLSWRHLYCGIKSLKKEGVTYYFIDNEYYFGRDKLYSYYDDCERFAFFSKAVIELMRALDFYPDVYNANDWQTALSVVYLERIYKKYLPFRNIKSVFTIHNIEYQGRFDYSAMSDIFGLCEQDLLEYDGCINLMKGAIECAGWVSTVSPTYAKEILESEKSHGLYHCLLENRHKLSGILNGIDYDYYDPASDGEICERYSAESPDGKLKNKKALLGELSLPITDAPLIAIISRLASHKGLDLIKEALPRIIGQNELSLVVLGTGESEYEEFFRKLEAEYPDKCRALIKYDRTLAKKLYAAADILLMPSKSEPCGLSQMIACRYGAVPVVRKTGGLADSIKPYSKDESGNIIGNGFSFSDYSGESLSAAITSALSLYEKRDNFLELTKKIMSDDFSWSRSAKKYLEMYEF